MIGRSFPVVVLLALSVFNGCASNEEDSEPTEVTVMTFNVLCSFCDPAYEPWENRLEYFGDILDRHDPDLIGLQELTWPEEVDQVRALREGFRAVYFIGETEGPLGLTDYPDATILYRAERFELIEKGFYWLSETPEEPWSTGWAEGLQFSRIVAWARLEELQSARSFLFVTTHFDNNPPNQEHSAPLLLSRTGPWAEEMPTVVTGDFNSQPDDPAYLTLVGGIDGAGFRLTNAFDIATEWTIDSNQDPVPGYDVDARIDHVFVAGENIVWSCPRWSVDLHLYGNDPMYPSDHRAISARLRFQRY